MILPRLIAVCLLISSLSPLKAVETVVDSSPTFNTNNNISSSVSGWSSGWGTGNTNTAWNYVGQVSDASGVYLGNGWVLTAAHVNSPTTFTLDGNVYNNTGIYYSNFTNTLTGTTNADLTLFQISTVSTTGTNLPLTYNLTITSTTPVPGQQVVMFGYGYTNGVGPESWGTNSAYRVNQLLSVSGFESIDFTTIDSAAIYGTVVLGDSGGGDFMMVGTNWELAGINEAVVSYTPSGTGSAFVQLSPYKSQISAIVSSVPEPSTWALLSIGLLLIALPLWREQRKAKTTRPRP